VDETTIPFLKLPGEIRNCIYGYALIDHDYSIRFEAEKSKRDGRCIVRRLFRARPGPADRDDLPGQQKGSVSKACTSYKRVDNFQQSSFSINLLQTCRQINSEAAPIFYGLNFFLCEAVPHLYAFLMHFQQRLSLVKNIGLCTYDPNTYSGLYRGPSHLLHTPLHVVFPLLAQATNLEGLYFHGPMLQNLSGRANLAAAKFFLLAHDWMHAMALHKKNKLAALDIVKMPALSSKKLNYPQWSTTKNGRDEFRTELAARLTVE
jgi:hypothetical protein